MTQESTRSTDQSADSEVMSMDRVGMDRGDDGSMKDGERSLDLRSKRSFHRKKVCRFCADDSFFMDYKDARLMQSFLSDMGKIVPRRISGNCALHQRKLTLAVKRARQLALVGFITQGAQGYEGRH